MRAVFAPHRRSRPAFGGWTVQLRRSAPPRASGGAFWRCASTLVAFAVALLLPAVAAACPYCAGQDDPGYGQQIAVGLMVASPYVVVGTVVFVVLRRLLKAGHRENQT